MKDISTNINLLKASRVNYIKMMDYYDLKALNYIPERFNNNLLWNFGHVIVTQALLTYGLSGNDIPIDKLLVNKYRKGSKPESQISQSELDTLKGLSSELIDNFQKDYENGVFSKFKPYPTSFGYEIQDINGAIAFNNVHEGMHIGTCIDLRRYLK